jgi:deoxyribodipyrimidine photo-lyase
MTQPVLVWLRHELRLADNPALVEAIASGRPVLPVFVLDDTADLGGAAAWWLHHSLEDLGAAMAGRGGNLLLRRGDPRVVIPRLIAETGAAGLYWSRSYDPHDRAVDRVLAETLRDTGVALRRLSANLLFEPDLIRNKEGRPYQVFSQFWRACLATEPPRTPLPAPAALPAFFGVASDRLDDWGLLPIRPDWAGGLREQWRAGAEAAWRRLDRFLDAGLATYHDRRDRPDIDGTSALSPHLRFGEISPHQIWHAVAALVGGRGSETYLKELGWREFSYHLLAQYPALRREPLRPAFARFPWQPDLAVLRAWRRGLTGYPLVDAGMRQLWQTGWMHNRVRMIVASFLVKHLLHPWQDGEAWFWDCLVDADPASNPASWQWVAGCGADAAPYFRIFNPILQGIKFDPRGDYVRRWVPELAHRRAEEIHSPATGIDGYPGPIVEHEAARRRALAALAEIKAEPSPGDG